MVPRRAAQAVGDALAGQHRVGRRQGDIQRGAGRRPGSNRDRRGRVEAPVAGPTGQGPGLRRGAAAGPERGMDEGVGRQAVARPTLLTPGVPGLLEEAQQPGFVDRAGRVEAVLLGELQLERGVGCERLADRLGPRRDLVGGTQLAAGHFEGGHVDEVDRRVDGTHAGRIGRPRQATLT